MSQRLIFVIFTLKVFSGFFPFNNDLYISLKSAIERLCLNDSSVTIQTDSSPALGQGFRLGFLGLLHMEVFSERLEKEFGQNVIITTPSLPYQVKILGAKLIKHHGTDQITIYNPCNVSFEKEVLR
jgi:translation elongation factor EF-4